MIFNLIYIPYLFPTALIICIGPWKLYVMNSQCRVSHSKITTNFGPWQKIGNGEVHVDFSLHVWGRSMDICWGFPSHVYTETRLPIPPSNQMLTPFNSHGLKKVPRKRDSYNFYLSQLRVNIECVFGILVNRFPILQQSLKCRLLERAHESDTIRSYYCW